MNYLLDTNACIALMRGNPPAVRARMERESVDGSRLHLPAIAVFELWYGAAKSAHKEANARRLALLLDTLLSVVPFDEGDARAAGQVRAALEQSGRPIGPYDILIAGQALARDLILVTANHREFDRIKGLRWEDWARPL